MDAVPDPDGAHALLAGRYAVGPLVGMGGTAQVYRAWDHESGCPVALKVFRPGSTPGPGYGGARELEVLTGVRHPGLVGVRGAGIDPQGCPFVVMDLVDGQSLSARLYDGPMGAADVARLGGLLADALAAVHARGVVHRDVKPGNVLLDADGHPWLTDFGIARIVDATRVTATGVVVGTAAYMAPEQVRGEAVGPPADVYALGLVLLEAVTGHREYDGAAVESALARLHRAPRVPETLPGPLAATLRRMTAASSEDRPTAGEVAAALRGRVPGEPVDRPVPARTLAATVARRAAPVAALACLVAGALVGALSLAGPERPAEEPRTALVPAAAPPALLAVPPVVADVDPAAVTPAPQPVPVALAAPNRTAARTGVRTALRATATADGSRDDDSDEADGETDRASRNAHRNDDAHDSSAGRDDDKNDSADEDKNGKKADTKERAGRDDDGDDGGDHDGGSHGGGSGDRGDKNDGGHGGKGGHSGSGSGKG